MIIWLACCRQMGALQCGESGQREREGFPSQGVTRPRSYQTKELLSNGVTKSRGYQACEPVCCLIVGEEIVRIIESTPLDDASDFEIDSDFMPILKEVRKTGGCRRLCCSLSGPAAECCLSGGSPPFLPVFTPHGGALHPTNSLCRPLPSQVLGKVPYPLNIHTSPPTAFTGPGQGAQHHPRGYPGHRPR